MLPTTGSVRLGAMVLLGALGAACSERPLGGSATDGVTSSTAGSTGTSPTGGTATTGEVTTGSLTATTGATATTVPPLTTTTGDSTTGEMSSLSDPDTSDSGCSFYGGCPPDFGNPELCDVWAQDCPVDQKCMPFSAGGNVIVQSTDCFPVARDPDGPGEACTVEGSPTSGIDSCDGTSMCVGADPVTLEGTCALFCTGSPDAPVCPAEDSCVGFGIGDLVNVCTPTCDPLMPACAPDQVCVSNPDDAGAFVCVVDVSGDGGALFEPCEFLNACDLGLACIASEHAVECDPLESSCCLPYCDLGMPECSGEGAQCEPWFEQGQTPAGLEDLGACVLPP